MEEQNQRRFFLKKIFSLLAFSAGSVLSLKNEPGFKIRNLSLTKAHGMDSTGKRVKKISIEEHCYTEGYMKFVRTQKWYANLGTGAASVETVLDLGEGRIKDMDDGGIDMQVLSLSFPYVEFFEPSDGIAIAKVVNDEISEAVKRYPKRFAGFAVLPTQASSDAAAEELERAVKKLGMVGAMVTMGPSGRYLSDQKYWVLLEMAEKLDVPIYIHGKGPNPTLSGQGNAMGGNTVDGEGIAHCTSLINSGVFDKYPKLKLIIGHGGESVPFWLARHSGNKSSNGRKSFMQSFQDNFYVSTSGQFWHPLLQFLITVMGSDRVLFAVDYPYESNTEASQFMETAPISDIDKEKICHLNAERIFNI